MKVYANTETKKAHAAHRGDQCRESEILKKNLVHFATLAEAEAAGYTPCKACYPTKDGEQ